MIICTSCGTANTDMQLICAKCGKKLQSNIKEQPVKTGKKLRKPPDFLTDEDMAQGRDFFKDAAKTWGIIIAALLALALGTSVNLWWPVMLITAVLALVVWGRMV